MPDKFLIRKINHYEFDQNHYKNRDNNPYEKEDNYYDIPDNHYENNHINYFLQFL